MKISPLIIPASLVLFLFVACEEESRPRNPTSSAANTGSNTYGYVPGDDTATDFVDTTPAPAPPPTTPAPVVTDQDVINAQSQSAPEPTTTLQDPVAPAPAPVEAARDLQYGTPVPGKAGFVTSPHAPYAGYVDVRGFPPNTEVKDPYSGKIFLVP